MYLLSDSRQQRGQHTMKEGHWESEGIGLIRVALPFGDYALLPETIVDTKRSIQEIAQNIEQDHERFRKECVKARDAGHRLIILVENDYGVTDLASLSCWVEPLSDFAKRRNAKRRYDGERLAKAMQTMTRKYGVVFEFCTPQEAGARVIELLGGGGDGIADNSD